MSRQRNKDTSSASDSGLTETEREELRKIYSEKIANLIELYYNEANEAVANATTAQEAHSAADNFRRNVDTAKMIDGLADQENSSLEFIFVLQIVIVVLCAIAILLSIGVLARKKSAKKCLS